MKATVEKLRGRLSGDYYALRIDGHFFKIRDCFYSRLADKLTGLDDAPHDHPKVREYFEDLARKFNE